MGSHYREAERAGGGPASEIDLAWRQDRFGDSAEARQRQALITAVNAFDSARLAILIGDDELRGLGIEPIDDLAGILTARIRALRLVLAGRADLADIPEPVPEYVTKAAIAYRQDRARRSGGRVPA